MTDKDFPRISGPKAKVARDLPIEQHVLHLRSLADVVDDHIPAGLRRLAIHDDADVGNSTAEVPCH